MTKKRSSDTATDAPRPPAVRRLALTCDLFRTWPGAPQLRGPALHNLEWLVRLTGLETLARGAGVVVETVAPPPDAADWRTALGDDRLAGRFAVDPGSAWAGLFDDATSPAFVRETERLLAADLVVGFELPRGMRRRLHAAGRRYLSLNIHPLRFLRDLCFGASTNCPHVAGVAASVAVPSSEVERRARWLRALFAHAGHAAFVMPEGAPLLAGQTGQDSVLIRDGRFETWTDHADRLDAMLRDHPVVGVLPHPHAPGAPDLLALLNRRLNKTVVLTPANSYGVLSCCATPTAVLSISSSLGVEAKALGHEARFLGDHPVARLRAGEFEAPGLGVPLGHGLLDPAFWRAVLGHGPLPQPVAPFADGDHHLRDSLESWAFAALRDGLRVAPCHKVIVPGADLPPATVLAMSRALMGDDASNRQGVSIHLRHPPLRAPDVLRLRGPDPGLAEFLAEGFHAPEAWGVWTSQRRSRLAIPVLRGATAQPRAVRLSLQLKIYDGLLARAPVLCVSSRGGPLALVCFRPGSPRSHTVHVDVPIENDMADVELALSSLASPSDEGKADQRQIGVGLVELSAQVVDEDPGIAPRGPSLWGVTDEPVRLPLEAIA